MRTEAGRLAEGGTSGASETIIIVTPDHAAAARYLRDQHGLRAEEILSRQIAIARSSMDRAELARLASVFCALVELRGVTPPSRR